MESTAFPYGVMWELEYIANSDQAFDALFPDKKPQLMFESESQKVIGNSGCNGYTAPALIDNYNMEFGQPGPSTLMYCGEGEGHFRSIIKRVNRWEVTSEGQLNLLDEGTVLLRFIKIQSQD